MDKKDLRPCPFCGGTNLDYARHESGPSPVHCFTCGARGPHIGTPEQCAPELWNQRTKEA